MRIRVFQRRGRTKEARRNDMAATRKFASVLGMVRRIDENHGLSSSIQKPVRIPKLVDIAIQMKGLIALTSIV